MKGIDEFYEDREYPEMGELEELSNEADKSEDTDDTGASVEAAEKQEEEIVTMEAAAVNGGDGDGVNTFAAAIVVEDEAVNAKCVGVAVKGDIMVKGSKANATAKGRVLTKEEHVEGYETREVLRVEMPRSSERIKKISQGLDVKALNFKTRKQRLKVQELQGSVEECEESVGKLRKLRFEAENKFDATHAMGEKMKEKMAECEETTAKNAAEREKEKSELMAQVHELENKVKELQAKLGISEDSSTSDDTSSDGNTSDK
ncbi:unnamed protein product [Closterium sp. Naga37s-1]|nr:unnamed protein product [Closterium sp. Naga37s-1]